MTVSMKDHMRRHDSSGVPVMKQWDAGRDLSESRTFWHQDYGTATWADADRESPLDLSVVIPVLNEAGNVGALCEEIHAALGPGLRYEVIFVDDGSVDGTADEVKRCMRDQRVRLLRHDTRAGQSMAVRTGVNAAKARWIATLDGDGQNDPSDLLRLYEAATTPAEETVALVMGFRQTREDSFVKRVSSRIANGVRMKALDDGCFDSGCGIKVFDRAVFLDLPWFDHMHRFLPALFAIRGRRARFLTVHHRPRLHGKSKYGIGNRLWVGIIDLLGVLWLKRRAGGDFVATEEVQR